MEKPSLTLERFYPVEPQALWRAWTDPQALKAWFGPGEGEPVSAAEVDLRVGGRFRIVFGGPDGRSHEVQGEYRKVEPGRELSFTWTWPNSTPERESLVTLRFRRVPEGTQLDFLHERFIDEAVRDNHRQGWAGALAKLERLLLSSPGTQERRP